MFFHHSDMFSLSKSFFLPMHYQVRGIGETLDSNRRTEDALTNKFDTGIYIFNFLMVFLPTDIKYWHKTFFSTKFS